MRVPLFGLASMWRGAVWRALPELTEGVSRLQCAGSNNNRKSSLSPSGGWRSVFNGTAWSGSGG